MCSADADGVSSTWTNFLRRCDVQNEKRGRDVVEREDSAYRGLRFRGDRITHAEERKAVVVAPIAAVSRGGGGQSDAAHGSCRTERASRNTVGADDVLRVEEVYGNLGRHGAARAGDG